MVPRLHILSPKRDKRLQTGWEGFFPYYAGFPELFARELLQSAKLPRSAVILDPWNGSGTTTYAASGLGLSSIGIDLNPVMIIVARARLLPPSEADHLRPLAATILSHAHSAPPTLESNDALLGWFEPTTAAFIRGIEQNIRRSLVGSMTKSPDGIHLDKISGTAATLYVALFAACRKLVAPFRSSNPTWLRLPKETDLAHRRLAAMELAVGCWHTGGMKTPRAIDSFSEIATARIELKDTDPPIWREVEVPTSITLKVLHDIVQATIGWMDYHLWEFVIDGRTYGLPADEDWGTTPRKEAAKVRLRDLLKPGETVITYTYDFGDDWVHTIRITDVRQGEPGVGYPRYVAGERNGPPEDCGGVPGFYDVLEARADTAHQEHETAVTWLDDYDPDTFDELPIEYALGRIAARRNAARARMAKTKEA